MHKCKDCDKMIQKLAKRCRSCYLKVNVIWNKGKKMKPEFGKKVSISRKINGSCVEERNPNWKGDDAKKIAKHFWVYTHKGRPSKCEHCKTTRAKVYDWANVDHQYKRNLSDYIRLCRRCHRRYDIANNNYHVFGLTK